MLKIQGLFKFYGRRNALNNINLELEPGTIIGLVGPNGAGKTTLLKCITGICNDYTGTILKQEQTTMGLVIDDLKGYADRTLQFNLKYFQIARGLNDYNYSLEILKKLNFDTGLLNSKLITFSYGMNQKVITALSLISNPQIMLLDEPFRGLDAQTISDFKNLLSELKMQNKAILFSSHNLNDIEEICDKVVVINNGTILDIIDARVVGDAKNISFNTNNDDLAMRLVEKYNPVKTQKYINLTLSDNDWKEILKLFIDNNIEVLNVSNNTSLADRVNQMIGGAK